ncbi:MAG: hypothetical protein BYD32DRAFT_271530 [Podila humilis]|nr:MAG: hypothetical protein BYD32DRAFT_271530 [Podila humilis]
MTKSKARKNSSSPATSPSTAGNHPGSLSPKVSTSNAHRAHTPPSSTAKHAPTSKSLNTSPLLPSLLPRSEPSPTKITTSPFFMSNRFGSLQIDPAQSTNDHESVSSESSYDSEVDDDDSSSESSNSSHGEEEDESESEDDEEEPESDEEEAPLLSPNSNAFNRAPLNALRKRVKATRKNMPPKQVQRIHEEQKQKQLVEVQSKQEKETHHHRVSEKEVSGTMTLGILIFPLYFLSFCVCVYVCTLEKSVSSFGL